MSEKKRHIAVRDFAIPCPRVGSIESHSGYGTTPQQGQLAHQVLQEQRGRELSGYRSEVTYRQTIDHEGWQLTIAGRADGVCTGDELFVEEIKTTLYPEKLARRLKAQPQHPYILQAQTYAHLHYLEHGEQIGARIAIVSPRRRKTLVFDCPIDEETFLAWWERRLSALITETRWLQRNLARRKLQGEKLVFPFQNPRPNQMDLADSVRDALAKEHPILVQAPTGMGKTGGVLYPSLKRALSAGAATVYVTPKNSQHQVALDTIDRFNNANEQPIRALGFTAKRKLCMKEETLCRPEYCEFADEHYTKVDKADLVRKTARRKSVTGRDLRKLAEKHEVCPFALAVEVAPHMDLVVCDYNYVFTPSAIQGPIPENQNERLQPKPLLIVDEAHNLPGRAIDYLSGELDSEWFEELAERAGELDVKFDQPTESLAMQGGEILKELADRDLKSQQEAVTAIDTGPWQALSNEIANLVQRYLESDCEILERDPLLELERLVTSFIESLDQDPARFISIISRRHWQGNAHVRLRQQCLDAAPELKDAYQHFASWVGFSATLKPFQYYAELSGLEPEQVQTKEFASPFPRDHRKVITIPQVSTKLRDRAREYDRITDAVLRIAGVHPGNYALFFPSYPFLREIEARLKRAPYRLLVQTPGMRANTAQELVDALQDDSEDSLLLAVQGGALSEGVDYQNNCLKGAFIIGPGLPNFDLLRRSLQTYYDQRFGQGFDYAFIYPAMAKVVQAAGRVIRSEEDRGIIVLMDRRFIETSYTSGIPQDWYENDPLELASREILKDVGDFWEHVATEHTDEVATD